MRLSVTRFATWRPDLKVWNHELSRLIGAVRLVVGSVNSSRIKVLVSYTKRCSSLVREGGVKGLTLYLATCHVLLAQSLPGSRLRPHSREIKNTAVARAHNGLPRIIPVGHRQSILAGDIQVIRLWMTLFGLYRILSFPGKLKLSTITNPYKGTVSLPDFLLEASHFINAFLLQLEKMSKRKLIGISPNILGVVTYPVIQKASASCVKGFSAFGSRNWDAVMWWSGKWSHSLFDYLAIIEDKEMKYYLSFAAYYAGKRTNTGSGLSMPDGRICNGRLSLKEEPAGKIRVFALVDYWTQTALKPLHDWLMSILRTIPQDGTFDQHKPVKRLFKSLPASQILYSYDLSAATDRLPVALQSALLSAIFGDNFGPIWVKLLVGRPYVLLKDKKYVAEDQELNYSVGQPMGALSSWAMLAFTHHFIVQYAAYLCGHSRWFEDYAVLGDDILIGNDQVAAKYLEIMSQLGVDIGIAKSLIAHSHTAEFAKVLYYRGEHVSGLPLKLYGVAQTNFATAINLLRVAGLSPKISLSSFGLSMGLGFRQAGRIGHGLFSRIRKSMLDLIALATHPDSQTVFSFRHYVSWLLATNYNTEVVPEQTIPLPQLSNTIIDKIVFPATVALAKKKEELENFLYRVEAPQYPILNWGDDRDALMNMANEATLLAINEAIGEINDVICDLTEIPFVESLSDRDSSPFKEVDAVLTQVLQRIDSVIARVPLSGIEGCLKSIDNEEAIRLGNESAKQYSRMRDHLGVNEVLEDMKKG